MADAPSEGAKRWFSRRPKNPVMETQIALEEESDRLLKNGWTRVSHFTNIVGQHMVVWERPSSEESND